MLAGRRLLLALGTLLLGLCSALPFSKRPAQPPAGSPTASGPLVLQQGDVALQHEGQGPVGQPLVAPEPPDEPSVRQALESGPQPPQPARLEPAGQPPQLPPVYPAPASPPPLARTVPPAVTADRFSNGSSSLPSGSQPPSLPPPRRHRIVDGDSLHRLAGKYWGRPEAYLKLYQANRHLLSSPDLLPLGLEIQIPPWQQVSQNAQPNRPSASPDHPQQPGLVPPANRMLVPVPPDAFP